MLRHIMVFFAGIFISLSAQAAVGGIEAIEEDFLADGRLSEGGDLGLVMHDLREWPVHVQDGLLSVFEARAREPGLSTEEPGRFLGDLIEWQVQYTLDDQFGGTFREGYVYGDLFIAIYHEAGGFWPGEFDEEVMYILDSEGNLVSTEKFYIE